MKEVIKPKCVQLDTQDLLTITSKPCNVNYTNLFCLVHCHIGPRIFGRHDNQPTRAGTLQFGGN